MQGSSWAQLLQRIPERQHENLVLVTIAGAEIMVQRIICHEDTYMILRGRPSGSTEVARTIVLPFDQINYLAFHRPMLERDVLAMFATEGMVITSPPPAKPSAEPPRDDDKPALADTTTPPADVTPPEPEPHAEPTRSGPPSKSILLARLRARLGKG